MGLRRVAVSGVAINALCLSCLLIYIAVPLSRNVLMMRRRRAESSTVIATNQATLTLGLKGIDRRGAYIQLAEGTPKNRLLLFVIRAENVESDLAFWARVSKAIGPSTRLRIGALCDGSSCIKAVNAKAPNLPFPVLEFTEVGNAQALVNADVEGNAVVDQGLAAGNVRLPWRSGLFQPETIAQEATK